MKNGLVNVDLILWSLVFFEVPRGEGENLRLNKNVRRLRLAFFIKTLFFFIPPPKKEIAAEPKNVILFRNKFTFRIFHLLL